MSRYSSCSMRPSLRHLIAPVVTTAAILIGPNALGEVSESARQNVTEALARLVPEVDIRSVRETGMPGILEVVVGANVVYVSQDGRYFLQGDVIDLDTRENLTDVRRLAARAAVLETLPVEQTIQFGPSEAAHTLYVFTDIDCGYCRRMHQEVDQLVAAGITVRYLSFPRSGVGSDSYNKFVSVYCSEDPRQALTDAKAGKDLPAATCENPVEAQFKLGESMGVQGTPAVFLESGEEIGGYVPANRLIEYFKNLDAAKG